MDVSCSTGMQLAPSVFSLAQIQWYQGLEDVSTVGREADHINNGFKSCRDEIEGEMWIVAIKKKDCGHVSTFGFDVRDELVWNGQ